MTLPSILSLYKIAVGPSSSHTLGCINIGRAFRESIIVFPHEGPLHLHVTLLGSLAHTGRGHLSDKAAVAGLAGYTPDGDADVSLAQIFLDIESRGSIVIGHRELGFHPSRDVVLDTNRAPTRHPNTILFHLTNSSGEQVLSEEYLSVGGGTILGPTFRPVEEKDKAITTATPESFTKVLEICRERNIRILDFILEHEAETHKNSSAQIFLRLSNIWRIMVASLERGLKAQGKLPGDLKLDRRAKPMFENYVQGLREWKMLAREITLANIYAVAIAEENANGGRVVTAPTCGSAGIVPAVLHMLKERYHLDEKKVLEGLAVAGFVGSLVVRHASISGAEVGCQGEVGVASAMAAAAACYIIGGTNEQIECAAEVALEHHLGLACDPVGGLVQIPCIERNAVGAVAALNASNLAFLTDGEHRVSFDNTVRAMREIGHDMSSKYKETALGGLATNWLRKTHV